MIFRALRPFFVLPLALSAAVAQTASAPSVDAAANAAPAPFLSLSAPPVALPSLAFPLAAPSPSSFPAVFAPAASPAPEPSALVRPVSAAAANAPEDDGSPDLSGAVQGRELFDAASPRAKASGGLWTRIRNWARPGDVVPAWPGTPGEKVRIGGSAHTLSRVLEDDGDFRVWRTEDDRVVVKILRLPPAPRDPGDEVPRVPVLAVSADGRVTVREAVSKGQSAVEVLRTGFETYHEQAWADLAAGLIRSGLTADLSPGNLVWAPWRSRWLLSEPDGVEAADPGKVLDQLLSPAARRAGVDAGIFLAALRGRLGPDSAAWRKTLAASRAADLAALAAYDRALPAPPAVVFAPSAERAPPYPDRIGPARDIAKTLGYDPLNSPHRALHADDPGKLNTQVYAIELDGKAPVVVKLAERGIIRREIAIRRVIRRWFSRYFDAPSAFGVEAGDASYLVMEFKPGIGSYTTNPLTREQRAALAVLVHAFGLGDMNPGNVFFPPRGKPVLIDFEQAFHRASPKAARLPYEAIAFDMPWVSRYQLNRAEDYQPAARAWRALLAEPASQDALLSDFSAAGFSAPDAAALLSIVKRNTEDLDWSIQSDVEFANQFAQRRRDAAPRQ